MRSRPEGAKGKAREVVLRVGGDEHATPYMWEAAIATALEEYARERVEAPQARVARLEKALAHVMEHWDTGVCIEHGTKCWVETDETGCENLDNLHATLFDLRTQLQTLRGEVQQKADFIAALQVRMAALEAHERALRERAPHLITPSDIIGTIVISRNEGRSEIVTADYIARAVNEFLVERLATALAPRPRRE